MKTAAAYVRVSTDDQIEYSPDSQIKKIKEYAESHDMVLPEEYIFMDEGISGRTAERRPAFMKMISIAKQKPKQFDVILLWKFSRFARNRQDAIFYKSMLRKNCGVDVVSITEQLSDDPTSILVEALLEAMDEYYSINLGQEVKRGMNEKFSRGGIVSIPSFGYDVEEGKYVVNEKEAPIVKMIFQEFVDGKPYIKIARQINEMGVRTKRGNLFENRTVMYILMNPVYIGKIRWTPTERNVNDRYHENPDTIIIDSNHEPIISEELFAKAQRRVMKIRTSSSRTPSAGNTEYMLKGLVKCSNCGGNLTILKSASSLQCHRYSHGICNVSHSIQLSKINKAVIEKIQSDLDGGVLNIKTYTRKHSLGPRSIEDMIEVEKKRLQRVKDAYESGVDTLEEYKENKIAILGRIKTLEEKINVEQADATAPTEAVRCSMKRIVPMLLSDGISEAAKNELLKSFVLEIIFNRTDSTIQIKYYVDSDS